MSWISVLDRLPTKEYFGVNFLCAMKIHTHFQEYNICEWWNPLNEGEINEFDDEVLKPHFLYENTTIYNSIDSREITHWMELPELPNLNK